MQCCLRTPDTQHLSKKKLAHLSICHSFKFLTEEIWAFLVMLAELCIYAISSRFISAIKLQNFLRTTISIQIHQHPRKCGPRPLLHPSIFLYARSRILGSLCFIMINFHSILVPKPNSPRTAFLTSDLQFGPVLTTLRARHHLILYHIMQNSQLLLQRDNKKISILM